MKWKKVKPHTISKAARLASIVMQIGISDIIFSLDSVFTAVGLSSEYWIMATAIFIAILTMLFLSETLSELICNHPSIKMLAFSFLLLIAIVLIADGLHFYIPKAYIYFAICYALFVEILNLTVQKKEKEVIAQATGRTPGV